MREFPLAFAIENHGNPGWRRARWDVVCLWTSKTDAHGGTDMIQTMTRTAEIRPAPLHEEDDRFVPLAAELGARIAPLAAEHDRDGSFVAEHYAALRESGYTRLIVPEELGGLGASLRQTCYAQAELARYCGSTALAVNMHLYVVSTNVYRWKHGAPGADGLLKRVANDGLILMT